MWQIQGLPRGFLKGKNMSVDHIQFGKFDIKTFKEYIYMYYVGTGRYFVGEAEKKIKGRRGWKDVVGCGGGGEGNKGGKGGKSLRELRGKNTIGDGGSTAL